MSWKILGEKKVGRLVNPTASELAPLFKLRLVGFNNRMYDNHILMGRYQGDSIEDCYHRSQRIIEAKDRDAFIPSAFALSYGDIKDISSTPMKSLKKWEIELGIHHQEMDLDWTQPAPPSSGRRLENTVTTMWSQPKLFGDIQDLMSRLEISLQPFQVSLLTTLLGSTPARSSSESLTEILTRMSSSTQISERSFRLHLREVQGI